MSNERSKNDALFQTEKGMSVPDHRDELSTKSAPTPGVGVPEPANAASDLVEPLGAVDASVAVASENLRIGNSLIVVGYFAISIALTLAAMFLSAPFGLLERALFFFPSISAYFTFQYLREKESVRAVVSFVVALMVGISLPLLGLAQAVSSAPSLVGGAIVLCMLSLATIAGVTYLSDLDLAPYAHFVLRVPLLLRSLALIAALLFVPSHLAAGAIIAVFWIAKAALAMAKLRAGDLNDRVGLSFTLYRQALTSAVYYLIVLSPTPPVPPGLEKYFPASMLGG